MAGALCASTNLQPPLTDASTTSAKTLKPPQSSSNFTPLSPRKPTKRRNYLRPKILKTLQIEPVAPTIPRPEDAGYAYELPVNEVGGIISVVDDVAEEIQVSETEGVAAGLNSGMLGKFSAKSVLKVGLGFVAVFLLQAICTVWILGEEDSEEEKNKNVRGKAVGGSGGNRGRILMNQNMFFMDKTVEEKIKEIRTMAREAREVEERRMRSGGEDGSIDDESMSSKNRIGFGKEIGARLEKVKKKYSSMNVKSLGLPRDVLDEFDDNDGLDQVVDNMLMFKKTQKFRGPSVSLTNDAKGFSSLGGLGENDKRKSGITSSNGDLRESISGENINSLQNDRKSFGKMAKEIGFGDNDTRFGTAQENSQGSVEVWKRRKSNSKMQKNQNMTKKSRGTTKNSKNADMLDKSGRFENGVLKNRPTANVTRANKSAVKSDFWWSNLPYVLIILMRRGSEQGAEGLFTLRMGLETHDENNDSHTVAFENHVDANNFCHLLESFFEDLGDFSADIIPLPVKELLAAVRSNTKKVIVVKKGQLKLYAGQPFADVEKALLSLVDQDPGASMTNIT